MFLIKKKECSQFKENGVINYTLLARDRLHLSRKGVAALGSNFKYRIRKFEPGQEWSLRPGVSPGINDDTVIEDCLVNMHRNVSDFRYVRPESQSADDEAAEC